MSAASSVSSNGSLIRSVYAAFGRGDVATVLSAFSPHIRWMEGENFIYADGNPYVGPGAVLEGVFMRIGADWDNFVCDPEEYVEEGEKVVCFGRYKGSYKKTGHAVNAQFVHAWTVQNGQVAAFQQYTDTAQFRDAVEGGSIA